MRLRSTALAAAVIMGTSSVLVGATGAAGATSPPRIVTTNFVCSRGVCAIGPGDVKMPFVAGLFGTGGPTYYGPECSAYVMKVVGGRLPPGLQLGEPVCDWVIFGTPTRTGTYRFTVQIAPQPNNLGQRAGPDGTQRFSITIGGGGSDRVLLNLAVESRSDYNPPPKLLTVGGFDVNYGATYTLYVTSTGQKIGTLNETTPDNQGDGSLFGRFGETTNIESVTVRDSLGRSATIAATVKR